MKSIRRQLTGWLVGGVVALSLVAGAGVYGYTRATLLGQFDSALGAKARALSSLVELAATGRLKFEMRDGAMPEFDAPTNPDYFEIRRDDGSVVERSRSLAGAQLPHASQAADEQIFWDAPLPDGRHGRAVRYRFVPALEDEGDPKKESPRAPATVVVAQSREGVDRALGVLLAALGSAGVLMAAGGAVLVGLVVRRGLAPVLAVAREAEAIETTSLHYRFNVASMPQELRPICQRLNDVLGRLETAFERERRFTADVAHELRTPIAELRTLAEVALKWPDQANAHEGFTDALAIARQMEAVATTLLAIARAEADRLSPVLAVVDLPQVVRERWRIFEARADQRNLITRLDLPAAGPVTTDLSLLRAMLGSVLENAVEYTPTGGQIEIRLTAGDGAVHLTTENTATGLTAADVAHAFEPFWRKDAARSDSGHSGLGLTLVAAYAKVLGIGVNAELTPAGRFRVVLRFAAAPAPPRDSHPAANADLSLSR